MNTCVVNVRREMYDVFIGRPSLWGNPFEIGRDGTREEVIAKYAAWIVTQTWLLSQVHLLRGQRLGCFCAPRACHGDVLVKLAHGESV